MNKNLTPGLYYSEMDSKTLIAHCNEQTKNATCEFSNDQIAEMISLAGCPPGFPDPCKMLTGRRTVTNYKTQMEELVVLASERIKI